MKIQRETRVETAELAELIKSRRSIRAWQDKPVPEGLLLQAVELATWAPNGANGQRWYFYIVLDENIIKAVADAVQANRDNIASWPEMAQSGRFPRLASAPQAASAPGAHARRKSAGNWNRNSLHHKTESTGLHAGILIISKPNTTIQKLASLIAMPVDLTVYTQVN